MKFSLVTLGLISAHVWCFSHFRQVISKFSEIMADNSQRLLVICNQVNLNVFPTYSKSAGLCSLNTIKSPIQFVYAGVLRLFFILNAFNCAFLAFCFKYRKYNYFCCEFLIINLSFVANFEVFESSQKDYFMFWWFKPIAFHLILHIQRFFSDHLYGLSIMVDKFSDDFL